MNIIWYLTKQLFSLIISILTAFYSAWVLTCLWAWFIIPWIEKAPNLPLIVAIGLTMIMKFFTYQINIADIKILADFNKGNIEESKQTTQSYLKFLKVLNLVIITVFLISGWLFHFLM